MTWGAVAGAAIGVVGSAMTSSGGSSSNGGAGTTTATKDPWLAAQPWIKSNMASGQALQNQYATTPFNSQQLGAYQNLGNQTNYVNALVPSLLGQISSQQVGFDRNNPNARPTAYNFNGTGTTTGGTGQGGLLSMLANPATSATSAANPTAAPAAAPAPTPKFVNDTATDPAVAALATSIGQTPSVGSYGSFTYGDNPQPGTQEYYDMKQYLAYGGADPRNLYGGGSGSSNPYEQLGLLRGSGTTSGVGSMMAGVDGATGGVGSATGPASGTGGLF